MIEPTDPALWIGYVRREVLGGWPPKFRGDRKRVSVRSASLANRLADLLEADMKERGELL